MPRVYKNKLSNFANLQHGREIGIKTLQEMFGRDKPLDVFDVKVKGDDFIVVGYTEGEEIPPEKSFGALLNDDDLRDFRRADEELVHSQSLMGGSAGKFADSFKTKSGVTLTLHNVIVSAQAKSELNIEEWNQLSEGERDAAIQSQLEAMEVDPEVIENHILTSTATIAKKENTLTGEAGGPGADEDGDGKNDVTGEPLKPESEGNKLDDPDKVEELKQKGIDEATKRSEEEQAASLKKVKGKAAKAPAKKSTGKKAPAKENAKHAPKSTKSKKS